MNDQLPEFLEELLLACPHTGEGVHNWLFKVARQLHAHMPALEIVSLLERMSENCGRFVPRSEIVAAVQKSLGCAWQPGNRSPIQAAPKWPSVNQEQRAAIIRDGGGLVDLWEASPARFDDNESHTEALIDALFSGNPLLCCGRTQYDFDTKPRGKWRGNLSKQQFIVPSPMIKWVGQTKEGKESAHCLDATGPRRFLVIEQDRGTIDEQAAVLLHLAVRAPLALAVHSGRKSIHGWFFAAGQSEERLCAFTRFAVSLGADGATWCRSQFVRMPDGTREAGKRQTVYFFNPEAMQ